MENTINENGCPACKADSENHTTFTHWGKKLYRYDYSPGNGELFSCAPSPDVCRAKRDSKRDSYFKQ